MTDMNDEALYRLKVDEHGVECTDPAGSATRVVWSEVTEIAIVTNDSGPIGIDVWLELRSASATCRVPQGAPGEKALLFEHIKDRFPDRNIQAVIKAMSSVGNAEFRVWPPT